MSKYLNTDRWMRKTSTGTLMLKRVSKEKEQQFPRKYREILRDRGPASLTKQVMTDEALGLSAAWDRVKSMCNS